MSYPEPSARLLYLDILAAAMLLTRIPVEWPEGETPETSRSYWAFAIVGVGVAFPPALIGGIFLLAGMPALAAAMVTLAGIALLTGGLHQDGLADVADGLGGRDPEHRLKIMRDSAIGSFGTLSLITVTVISAASLATIAGDGVTAMIYAMISCAALSRSMMAVQRHFNAPPEGPGLASMTGKPSGMTTMVSLLTGVIISISFSGLSATFFMTAVGLIITAGLGVMLKRLLGGVNGDGIGATQQLTEAAMLVILVMAAA